MAVIEVDGVRKAYDGRTVLDGVSLTVDEGEIVGILGPNGAGKTTLVECIEGLRRHDAGTIRVLGLDPHRDGPALRRVLGAQLQASALQPRLRVGEALALYATFHTDPVDPVELAGLLGLDDHLGRRVADLSGGLEQRLAIALALVGRPRVAVLDELTTGLDPQARRATWSVIEAVRDRGVSIVLVTHAMDEADRLCDRVAVLDGGRIVGLDRPAALVAEVAGQQRLRFVPSAPFDLDVLRWLPDVVEAVEVDGRTVVTGSGNVVQRVMVTLDHLGVVPDALRVEQHDLEEVFVALTGQPVERTTDEERVA